MGMAFLAPVTGRNATVVPVRMRMPFSGQAQRPAPKGISRESTQ